MQLSFTVSLQRTRFGAVVFEDSIDRIFEELKTLGYDGVELAIRNPGEIDAEKVLKLVTQYNLQVPAIGTGQAFIEEGLSLSSLNPEIRRKAQERIKSHILFAAPLRSFVIIGLIRGTLPEDRKERDLAMCHFCDSLAECASFAEKQGVRIVIEPLNRYETNFLNTVEETLELINSLGHENIGILADTFHMNIEEQSITSALIRAGKFLWHFHAADSNRWAPGFGHLNFQEIIQVLNALGYSGFISAEILQKPSFQEAARKSIYVLREALSTVLQ